MIPLLLLLQVASPPPPAGFTVTVTHAVSAEGQIEDGAVTGSSGRPDLDAAACRLLTERGRFTPKRGAGGRPVRVEGLTRRFTFADHR